MGDIALLGIREALFLGFITAMGVGPAAFLTPSFSRAARTAFTPILGLSIAVCMFTTIEWFIDGNQAQWIVIPIAVLSTALGIWRHRPSRKSDPAPEVEQGVARKRRSIWRPITQMFLVVVAVSLPTAAMLASQHSIGPTAYEVYDSPGYVANADGAQVLSIGNADHAKPPFTTLELAHWVNQVQTNNRLDIAPVSAAIDALTGLHGTETWAAYLLAVLAAGALALYGAICVASRTLSWFAVIGSGLIGGAFSLQLVMDGSQAAIVGLAFVVPLLLLIRENATTPTLATLFLTALVLSGLTTVYPIFFLPVLATGLIYVALSAANRFEWHPRAIWPALLRSGGYIIAIFVLSCVFDLVAAIRNIPGWVSILDGGGGSASQPQYHLGFGVVASWLLQVRDFYTTAFGPQSVLFDVVPTLVIPLVCLLLIVYGLRRVRAVWIPLLFIGISAVSATKQVAVDSCAYCEDRSLLPVVPVALFVMFTILATLMSNQSFRNRCIGAVGAAIYLSFAGLSLTAEQDRFTANGYFLPDAIRNSLAVLPRTGSPVELEGFGTVPFPTVLAEEALPYEELLELEPSGVSFISDEPGQGIVGSFGPTMLLKGPSFHANYEYIVTRVPEITTGRKVLFESNGIALEQRSTPLDVTLKGGLNAEINASQNGGVGGWVNGPLNFIVTGTSSAHEKLQLQFFLPSTQMNIPLDTTDHLKKDGAVLHACLPITQTSTGGIAAISSLPINAGIVLHSMVASYGTCT